MSRRIGFVLGDHGPSGYYRLALPCEALKAAGDDVGAAIHYADFEGADILVFQRQHKRTAIAEILKWKARGKKIVVDFDDNFLQLDPHNQACAVYTPPVVADLKLLIGAADALTVTTEPLANAYSDYADKIFVLPNCLPERAFDYVAERSDSIVVGWQGSASHLEDLKMLRSPLSSLARKYDFDVVLAGHSTPGISNKAIVRSWIKFSADLGYYKSFADFNIGLCPLAKTAFNEGKSDLKWLEYSSLGIATVASALAPYDEVEEGVTGLLARNISDWERQISRLLKDADLRRRLGDTARDYVKDTRTITANIARWRQAYAAI